MVSSTRLCSLTAHIYKYIISNMFAFMHTCALQCSAVKCNAVLCSEVHWTHIDRGNMATKLSNIGYTHPTYEMQQQ